MEHALANIVLAFAEGFELTISPTILSILPIIFVVSLLGNKKLPWGVGCGFIFVFALFTIFSRDLVKYTGIDLDLYRAVAFVWLIVSGIIMLSDYLTTQFGRLTRAFTSGDDPLGNPQGSFGAGFLIGMLTAVIWTPYAGPLVAEAIVQTVTDTINFSSFIVLLAFAYGAILPIMVIVAIIRVLLITRTSAINSSLRKLAGLIIIFCTVCVAYKYHYTATTFTINGESVYQTALIDGLKTPYPAPDIEDITAWINSEPLTKDELRGKVVLLNFSTYSCINCIRALPYLVNWFNQYRDNGLLVIDIHSPEFDFEKSVTNVRNAAVKFSIPYPIALDSNFATWKNFHNEYWPSQYLIDKNGNVVYQHIGEGGYATTENNIRFLLGFNKIDESTATTKTTSPLFHHITPVTYLGFNRSKSYAGTDPIVENDVSNYSFPPALSENAWALKGKWTITDENIISANTHSAIKIKFYAQKVLIVMGTDNNQAIPVKITLNGKELGSNRGQDVSEEDMIQVSGHGLYEVLSLAEPIAGELELEAPREGLEIYTFTFG
jgi:cytochrome c biogenesis protein CcdA/thiol-disulfide isomerase/thioredoxin